MKFKTIKSIQTDKDRIQHLKELFQSLIRLNPNHKLRTLDGKINDKATKPSLRD